MMKYPWQLAPDGLLDLPGADSAPAFTLSPSTHLSSGPGLHSIPSSQGRSKFWKHLHDMTNFERFQTHHRAVTWGKLRLFGVGGGLSQSFGSWKHGHESCRYTKYTGQGKNHVPSCFTAHIPYIIPAARLSLACVPSMVQHENDNLSRHNPDLRAAVASITRRTTRAVSRIWN